MARFLFTPVPVAGHFAPAVELADGLIRRGHEVTIITGARFEASVERVGARFVGYRSAPDLEFERLAETFPERPSKPGIRQARWDLKRLVIDLAAEQDPDVAAAADAAQPDVIVSDILGLSGQFVAERTGTQLALLNPINLMLRSADTFPDGMGIGPSSTTLGRLRNRAANRLVFDLLLGDVNRHLHKVRARLGLAAVPGSFIDMPVRVSQLILQPTAPEFEYPRSDLPQHVHFIGPLLPGGRTEWEPPAWWDRLEEGRPVVLVTQGTIATDFDDLIRPTLTALASDDVFVIATTGGRSAEAIVDPPPNAIVEPFVPFAPLLPHVDVMVSNGGYGGIHYALAAGVPLVVAGRSEDKVETTARVAWSGVGIDLRTDRPTRAALRDAVRTVLRDGRYRERARTIQARLADLDGPSLGAELLEQLADRDGPVLRSGSPWLGHHSD